MLTVPDRDPLADRLAAHPDDPRLRREVAVELVQAGRPGAALALAQSAPLPAAEAAALAEALLRRSAWAEAVAVLRRPVAEAPRPALVGPFIEAGLPAFRQTINDGADMALLAALAEAAIACPWVVTPTARAELIRLLETQGRGDLIPRLLGRFAPAERASLYDAAPTAEGMTRCGLLLAAGGRFDRARGAFETAEAIAPGDPVAALNAGFAALADGDIAAARESFARMAPGDEAMLSAVAWPRAGRLPWPWGPLPKPARAGFEALLPEGAAWPRISLVTPSYMQGDTLEATILSVAHQGYPNLQYIVLDADSRDASRAVIARQAEHIDIAVLEPDRGQVDALNKGFALADGALLGWLNADDMLAPGALFAQALAWLGAPQADIVHGACLAARDGGLVGLQIPLHDGRPFDSAGLADLHGGWLRGAYFLQPETLFTRRLLDAVGGLDEGLRFTPDYALWAAAAARGARLVGTAWPTAIYRLHPGQKTAQRRPVLLEQIQVRDALAPMPPAAPRRDALRAALARTPLPVLLVPHPRVRDDIAAPAFAEAAAALAGEGIVLTCAEAPGPREAVPAALSEAAIILRLTRPHDGPGWAASLRAAAPGAILVAWLLEDLRDPIAHNDIAPVVDFLLPSHAEAVPLLAQPQTPLLPAIPLPITSIGPARAAELLAEAPAEREPLGAPPPAWLTGEARFRHRLASRACPVAPGDDVARFEALLAGQTPILPAADMAAVPLREEDPAQHVLAAWVRKVVAALRAVG